MKGAYLIWKKVKWIIKQSRPIFWLLIIMLVINSALSLVGVYNALVSKSLIDSAISANSSEVIKWLLVMAGIILGKMLLNPIVSFISTYITNTLSHNMQKNLYENIIYSQYGQSSKHHSVSLLTRLTNDVNTITNTITNLIPTVVTLMVTLIASLVTLLYLAPKAFVVALVLGPVLVILTRVFGKKIRQLYRENQDAEIKYRTFIQESINNIMVVKAFSRERMGVRILSDIQKEKLDVALRSTKINVQSSLVMETISTATYFTIFCFGAINISKGTGTYGTMTAMLQLYGNVQGPLSGLANSFPQLIGAVAAAERLMEIEEMSVEKGFKKLEDEDITFLREINGEKLRTIEFKDLSYSCTYGNEILNKINLNINSGETIALVGESGEGKSTIIRLLLALHKPSHGGIYLKTDKETVEVCPSHRRLMSYVPQGNTLFSGTIEENLRYGKADATKDEIYKALKAASALEFVNDLESGINSKIGERGIGLSQGQAQRIAIARAILRGTPILILDESTSTLDPETEVSVINGIKNLDYNPTCIIITHKPIALSICDRVIKVQDGAIRDLISERDIVTI